MTELLILIAAMTAVGVSIWLFQRWTAAFAELIWLLAIRSRLTMVFTAFMAFVILGIWYLLLELEDHIATAMIAVIVIAPFLSVRTINWAAYLLSKRQSAKSTEADGAMVTLPAWRNAVFDQQRNFQKARYAAAPIEQ